MIAEDADEISINEFLTASFTSAVIIRNEKNPMYFSQSLWIRIHDNILKRSRLSADL